MTLFAVQQVTLFEKRTGQSEQNKPVDHQNWPEHRDVEDREPGTEEPNCNSPRGRVPELELRETANKGSEFFVLLCWKAAGRAIFHVIVCHFVRGIEFRLEKGEKEVKEITNEGSHTNIPSLRDEYSQEEDHKESAGSNPSVSFFKMNKFRALRPIPSHFKASTLPAIARSYSVWSENSYEFIQTTEPRPGVGQITLNRPKALNALSTPLITEMNSALQAFDANADTSVILLTGSQKAFAAGADIKEMANLTFSEAYTTSFIESWSFLTTNIKKPIIAAVSGHALGGGCELALMADILYCTEGANFGQPEIKLGTIPGAGGSQRLTRAIGKARAMELILTGKNFTGKEAGEWGVAARTFATWEELMEGSLKTAETIAGYSKVAIMAAKEVVNKSQDLPLRDGVEHERRVFHSLFGSQDQKIGMKAFAEKKRPEWSNK
ncbi:enoyl-CoA hydratase [Diplocarpon rosae]|nr:enoyl-CoA hydratase [Diplocarpon rosae]